MPEELLPEFAALPPELPEELLLEPGFGGVVALGKLGAGVKAGVAVFEGVATPCTVVLIVAVSTAHGIFGAGGPAAVY